MKRLCLLALGCLVSNLSLSQKKGSFTDERDGQSYEMVTYSVNLSSNIIKDLDEYGTYLAEQEKYYEFTRSDSFSSSVTWMVQNLNYETLNSKCLKDLEENCESNGRLYTWYAAMKACPQGWHVPSDDDWFVLASLYGGVSEAGKHLKSTDLGGTNRSLFNVKKPSIFWSSDELDGDNALDWKVNYRWVKLQRWKGGKNLFNSVRCVQDY